YWLQDVFYCSLKISCYPGAGIPITHKNIYRTPAVFFSLFAFHNERLYPDKRICALKFSDK
ncbi:hypothetical protein, partial [Salmonella enterica]|uniref:hypothetical protein n=1 Tax=Salmonella enterica TaxID=28901 RepID=UPI001C392877